MSSYGDLWVGPVLVSSLRNGVGNELMAVFRDDMMHREWIAGEQYYGEIDEEAEGFEPAEFVEVVKFRAPGEWIAARLDLMGLTPSMVYGTLESQLSDRLAFLRTNATMPIVNAEMRELCNQEFAFLSSLSVRDWIKRLGDAPSGDPEGVFREVGSRRWFIDFFRYWDERLALRAVLLSFPSSEVVLDITDLELGGWLDSARSGTMAWDAVAAIGGMFSMHSPVVVLTEGRTDAEFLKAGLEILYPHLTDLIRFLDYDQKNEGGAGFLVRMVRAFAAAGIANRVIALFDNDSAATDALRVLDLEKLPPHIRVCRYPALKFAESYPTLGPPREDLPEGGRALANVNGLAGSIELYLGKDVLTGDDGRLRPIQWKSHLTAISRYQGEVVEKSIIHEAFRMKCRLALRDPEAIMHQDWTGVRLIIDEITDAAQAAFGGLPG
jgi:hypothetical protein